MRSELAILGLMGMFAMSTPVDAQVATPITEGPAPAPVTVQGGVVYDSNVARSSKALAAARGLVLQDEIYSPQILLDLQKPVGRETAYLTGEAGYDFHQHNTILNRERINLEGGLLSGPAICQFALKGDYARQQSDLQDLNIAITKNTATTSSVALNGQCGHTTGLAPYVAISQSWLDNSAVLFKTTNNKTFSGSGGIAYRRPELGSVSIFGEYEKTDFPDRFIPFGAGLVTDGYKLYAGGIKYEKSLDTRLDVNFSLSQTSIKSDTPTGINFKGLVYQAGATYHFSPRLALNVNFDHATTPSNRLGATYSVNREYLGSADYKLDERASLSVGASYTTNNYRGADLNPATDISEQKTRSFFGSANYILTPHISLMLTANSDRRTANLTRYNYVSNRIGLSVAIKF